MNSECSGEGFIFFFCCIEFSVGVRWEDKERYIVISDVRYFYSGQILFVDKY